jgi:phenylalanyl-tRNA synthetase beta chain
MPVIALSTDRLRRLLGTEIESGKLAEAIDQLGCDLEEVAEVLLHECPACGALADRLPREEEPKDCGICGHRADAPFAEVGADEVVRIELEPARPDLFDSSGLVRALLGYLGIRTGLPDYPVEEGGIVVTVDPSVRAVRPHIVCAEVEVPPLDRETLVEVFQLQENLHWAVGRGRRKASIGVYDLAAISREICYTAWEQGERFVPLGMPGRELTLREILDEHPKGTAYRELLTPFDRYPILVDERGQVLSMPPIINSEETKVGPGSSRLFVDVTGVDRRAAEDCLAITVCSLRDLGGTVRSVTIRDGDDTRITPDVAPYSHPLSAQRTAGLIGVDLTEEQVVDYLDRMRLGVGEKREDGRLAVVIPRYRVDVKHEVDLIEDVAIAHGYHELPSPLVPTMTVGEEHPTTSVERRLRGLLTGLGFLETVNFVLTNREEHLRRMGLPEDLGQVEILNPISVNQEIVRTNLLSSLMGVFALNKTREMPQPVFELGEVVRATDGDATQSSHLGVGVMGPRADYARIRSTMDSVFRELGLAVEVSELADHELLPVFLPGRAALIRSGDRELGVMGEVHPEVIEAWTLDHPVVLAEIDLDPL